MQIKGKAAILAIILVLSAIGGTSYANPWSDVTAMSDNELTDAIVKLDLGFEKYRLGGKLTDQDIELSRKNPVKNAYPGTVNFKDGDVGIVADHKTKTIIAIYLDENNADQSIIKDMIGKLMVDFGQPTTMAHEKIVYWAFNSSGRITEEQHSMAKKPGELNILATVKFSSKEKIMENEPGKGQNSIYCIISSPELLKRYVKK